MQQNKDINKWYIRSFVGASGWLSSLFFIIFFFLLFNDVLARNSIALGVIGLLLIVSSYHIFKSQDGDFIEQFALSNIFTGEALLSWVIVDNMHIFIVSVMFAILMWLVPNYIHRVMASFGMGISLFISVKNIFYVDGFIGLFGAVVLLLLLYKDKFEDKEKVEAIIYGMLGAFIFINYADWFMHQYAIKHYMVIEGTLGVVLAFAIWKILSSYDLLGNAKVVVLSTIGVLLSVALSFWVHNLMIPIVILIISFWQQDRKLIYLSILLGLFSLSRYYYFMGDTLLDKSKILLLSSICFAIAYGTIKALFKKDIHV